MLNARRKSPDRFFVVGLVYTATGLSSESYCSTHLSGNWSKPPHRFVTERIKMKRASDFLEGQA
jgi:hypothetical protein